MSNVIMSYKSLTVGCSHIDVKVIPVYFHSKKMKNYKQVKLHVKLFMVNSKSDLYLEILVCLP